MSSGVWLTGVGAVSPGGWTAEETWQRVVSGRSCARAIDRFDLCGAEARYGAPVPGLEHEVPADTSLSLRFAASALDEAMADAGLERIRDRVDVVLVATHGERQLPRPDRPDPTLAGVLDVVDAMRQRADAARGSAVYGACASGALVIGTGMKLIQSGQADVVVAGASDAMLREVDFFAFCALYAMSTRDCPPEEACCPFDARRDGFLMAEGAAFVVLESEAHARKRDAPPAAVLAGFGAAQNAYHSVASPPDAGGPRLAIKRALDDARVSGRDVDYINAHGTSTRDNDWCETLAIHQAFGAAAESAPVSSSKGVLGHTMAPAGVIETVLCVKALRDGVIPPTANYATADLDCDLDYVPNAAREMPLRRVVTNSFGFGGHNACLVLESA